MYNKLSVYQLNKQAIVIHFVERSTAHVLIIVEPELTQASTTHRIQYKLHGNN